GGDAGDAGDAGDGSGATPNNYVFATSSTYLPNLGGLAGADTLCMQRATAAGLPGHYVAWLSTSAVAAPSRLVLPGTANPARGWIRPDGRPVTDRISDLLAGTIYYPIRVDEAGLDLETGSHEVLTGTRSTGV